MPFTFSLFMNVLTSGSSTGIQFNPTFTNVGKTIRTAIPEHKKNKPYYVYPFCTMPHNTRFGTNIAGIGMSIQFNGISQSSQTFAVCGSNNERAKLPAFVCNCPFRTDSTTSTHAYIDMRAIDNPPCVVNGVGNIDSITFNFYVQSSLNTFNSANSTAINNDTPFVILLEFVEIDPDENYASMAGSMEFMRPLIF